MSHLIELSVVLLLMQHIGSSGCAGNQNFLSFPEQMSTLITSRRLLGNEESQLKDWYTKLSSIEQYSVQIGSTTIATGSTPNCPSSTPAQSPLYVAWKDIWVCLKQYYSIQCNLQWEITIKCGTYLEVHRPFDPEVLVSLDICELPQGSPKINLTIANLCAGTYHIWLVYYTRIGKTIKAIKAIFVGLPSCTCT